MNFLKEDIDNIKKEIPFFKKNFCEKLFNWQDLENLLNLRPFVNIDRFHIVPLYDRLEWNDTAWLSDANSYPPNVINDYIKKSVCYFSDSSRVNQKINNFCNTLENITQWPTDAHIYFSLKEKNTLREGFGIHNDIQHNIIVAVEGKIKVSIFSKILPKKDETPIIEQIMENGDCVYVPKDYFHCVSSIEKRISISFPMASYSEIKKQDRLWIKL